MAVAFSGCGGGSTSTTARTPAATTSSGGAGAAASTLPAGTPTTLRGAHGGVLLARELPGFAAQGHVALGANLQQWVAALPPEFKAAEEARLKALGFVAGLTQRLTPAQGAGTTGEAISLVEQFRSAHGASGEVAAQLEEGLKHGQSAFAVPGIPGARGFGASTDANVAFTVGPYYYIVAYGGAASAPTRAQLITAAQGLYRRVSP